MFKPAGLLVLLLAMGCAINAPAPLDLPKALLTVPPNKAWLACAVDSECSATSLSCNGWIAINRAHESDVQHWYSAANADLLSVVECSDPLTPAPAVACRAGVCRVK